jgi:hypothetical protein
MCVYTRAISSSSVLQERELASALVSFACAMCACVAAPSACAGASVQGHSLPPTKDVPSLSSGSLCSRSRDGKGPAASGEHAGVRA